MAKTGETPGQTETNHVTLDVDIASGERVEIVIESLPGTGELRVIRSDQAAVVTSGDTLEDYKDSAGEFPAGRFQKKWKSLIQQFGKPITLQPNILFLVGIILYLVIHLWGLDKFPIYFSCDEAVNPVLANYLVRENFKSGDGELLPTFFKNGGQYCLSTSVYMQLPTTLLFGISVVTTRATFAIISVLTAFWIGFTLRDIFKIRIWWLAPYLLSILPIWFLLSRAAYEYSLQVTFFAGFTYYYLRYRTSTPKAIIPAIVCGSLSFYSYTPGQIVMVVIGLLLLITDWKYHWLQRKTNLKAAGVFVLMLLPLVRFFSFHPTEYTDRLLMYNSYLVSDVSIGQKILQYFQIYFQALNPLYWFLPNQVDNPRFLMLGYAHLTWWLLPFLLAGIGIAIRFIRKPEFRFLLLALLAAPAGTALVKLTVHRVLVIVVPVVFLSLIAMHYVAGWVLNRSRIKTGLLSFFLVIAFSAGSLVMLMDAITHGSTWYKNYGISGMQYGAMQVFSAADTYQQSHPEVTVYISPNWTFQSERVREFFIHNDQVKMGTVDEALRKFDPEISDKVFVLLPDELQRVQDSGLFSIINEEMELPYPDGSRGFTFVHLEYAENVDEVFARLRVQSIEPVETSLVWMGQQINIIHSPLDMGPIEKIMDGDTKSLVKTKANNPLKVEILFSQPVRASGMVFSVGAEPVKITARIQKNIDGIAHEYIQEAGVVDGYKDVIVNFGKSMEFQVLRFELLDTLVPEDMPVHLWEIRFLP